MTSSYTLAAGDQVVCADDEPLGLLDSDEGTHLRVRRPHEDPALVWVSKRLITGVDGGVIRLMLNRDELHDGVIALPPARQREYGSLVPMQWLLQRQGHRAG